MIDFRFFGPEVVTRVCMMLALHNRYITTITKTASFHTNLPQPTRIFSLNCKEL